jgi:SNF2 family DNA or RNA helicase
MKLFDKIIPKLLWDKHRILIFSQFKMMLNILEDYFYLKMVKYLRLDGEVPSDVRQNLIDEFNKEDSEYPIFLLSTRAGGLGINLTRADTIFIFDSDFNPHNDIQAQSRAHRIGQKNNLVIYRLVCHNTCEQK